jgi:spore maturation protein B
LDGAVFYAMYRKEKVYDVFTVGVKEGFEIVFGLFPTLLAIIVAINIFIASGALDILISMLLPITNLFKIPSEVIPIGIMRSFSGGASLGLLTDILATYGPDSLIGNISSTIMSASETTIYVFAIYTSTVGIKDTKYGIYLALLLDVISVIMAILLWNIIM